VTVVKAAPILAPWVIGQLIIYLKFLLSDQGACTSTPLFAIDNDYVYAVMSARLNQLPKQNII
jgi:hypothetical protein